VKRQKNDFLINEIWKRMGRDLRLTVDVGISLKNIG